MGHYTWGLENWGGVDNRRMNIPSPGLFYSNSRTSRG